MVSTSSSFPAPMLKVSPSTPGWVSSVTSAEQWSSTWIQSRRFSPVPYTGSGWSSIAFVTNSGTSFSGYWRGP